MLDNRYDAPRSDAEWQAFLQEQTFGQFIVVGREAYSLVVPTHYTYDPERGVEFHLHRANPALRALHDDEHAVFAVTDASVYIPASWNANERGDPAWSAPTSYYAAVQVLGRAVVLDDPDEVAAVLNRQLRRLQPEGGYHTVAPGANPFGRMLPGIRAVRIDVEKVRAKFEFGGNRTRAVQDRIAERLAERGGAEDLRAREHLVRRQ